VIASWTPPIPEIKKRISTSKIPKIIAMTMRVRIKRKLRLAQKKLYRSNLRTPSSMKVHIKKNNF